MNTQLNDSDDEVDMNEPFHDSEYYYQADKQLRKMSTKDIDSLILKKYTLKEVDIFIQRYNDINDKIKRFPKFKDMTKLDRIAIFKYLKCLEKYDNLCDLFPVSYEETKWDQLNKRKWYCKAAEEWDKEINNERRVYISKIAYLRIKQPNRQYVMFKDRPITTRQQFLDDVSEATKLNIIYKLNDAIISVPLPDKVLDTQLWTGIKEWLTEETFKYRPLTRQYLNSIGPHNLDSPTIRYFLNYIQNLKLHTSRIYFY